MKRKTAANASSDLNNNNDNNPEAENDDETTRRTNNSAMPNAPPESVAWLPPLDRLSFAEDDEYENSEKNLTMRNERTYESKSGESAYTIARKDGESTIDDENEEEFIEYKEKVERVQDVMEFISKNKNWLKLARTQKMREYRAKTGLVVGHAAQLSARPVWPTEIKRLTAKGTNCTVWTYTPEIAW